MRCPPPASSMLRLSSCRPSASALPFLANRGGQTVRAAGDDEEREDLATREKWKREAVARRVSGKWVYGWRARLWNESLALSFSRGLACFVSRTGGGCGLKPSALAVCAITAREAAIERVIVIALLTSPADVSLRKESDRGTGVRMSASSRVNEFRGRGGEEGKNVNPDDVCSSNGACVPLRHLPSCCSCCCSSFLSSPEHFRSPSAAISAAAASLTRVTA